MGRLIARILVALGVSEGVAADLGTGITLVAIFSVVKALAGFLYKTLSYPLVLAGIVAAFMFAPDTIVWIFMKIGEMEMLVVVIVINELMPEVIGAGGNVYTSWSELWSAGLSVLPADMLEVINGLGVAQILGLITATIGAVSTIRIYRKVMLRAGLL